jgi:hypothetical protein
MILYGIFCFIITIVVIIIIVVFFFRCYICCFPLLNLLSNVNVMCNCCRASMSPFLQCGHFSI